MMKILTYKGYMMEHNNPRESNYQVFIDKYDPEKKLNNKDKSALHACYLIKSIVDKNIHVNFSYHSFIHGEEGDSEATLKENKKGAIFFSFNDNDIMPNEKNYTREELYYDRSQLALISLKYTKLLKYINKMVINKYPSDKEYDHQKEEDSRAKFYEKLCSLKYERSINNKVVEIKHSRITQDNFSEFLNILLTEQLIKEFENIVDKDVKEMSTLENLIDINKQKIKM